MSNDPSTADLDQIISDICRDDENEDSTNPRQAPSGQAKQSAFPGDVQHKKR